MNNDFLKMIESICKKLERFKIPEELLKEIERTQSLERQFEFKIPEELLKKFKKINDITQKIKIPEELLKQIERTQSLERQFEFKIPEELLKEIEIPASLLKEIEIPASLLKEISIYQKLLYNMKESIRMYDHDPIVVAPIQIQKQDIYQNKIIELLEKVINMNINIDINGNDNIIINNSEEINMKKEDK